MIRPQKDLELSLTLVMENQVIKKSNFITGIIEIKEEDMDFEDERIRSEQIIITHVNNRSSFSEKKLQVGLVEENNLLMERIPNTDTANASKIEINKESFKAIRSGSKCIIEDGGNTQASCSGNDDTSQSNFLAMASPSCSGSTSDFGSSLVWKYFERLAGNRAKCQLCHNSYSRKGGSTSGLMNHLRSMHKFNYRKLMNEDEDRRIPPHLSTPRDKTSSLITGKLDTKQTASSLAKDSSKFIDFRIAEMVCLDDLPFSFVEGRGFVRFMSMVCPSYILKEGNFYSQLAIENIFESVSKVVKLRLKNLNHNLSFTIDEYFERSAHVSLLRLTCHRITEDFKRVQIVLCAKPLFERKAENCIAEQFHEMIYFWDIPINRIHVVMGDSEVNKKNELKITSVDLYDCTVHNLQLVVNAGLAAQRTVQDIIVKCKLIATRFNNSVVAQEELKKQQIRLKQPELCVLQDVSTNWNSTFYMLKRTLETREPLVLFLASKASLNFPHFESSEWNIMQQCIDVLDPFEQLTRKLSEPSSSIADVIPMIASLRSFCEDEDNDSGSGLLSMKETLRTELDRRFDSLETIRAYTVATYLDPRYKGKVFSNDKVVDQTQEEIVKLCMALSDAQEPNQATIVVDKLQRPARETSAAKGGRTEKSKSLHDRLKLLINTSNEEKDSEDAGLTRFQKKAKKEISIKNMIEDYDLQKNIEIDDDPLNWWNDNKSRYSLLSDLARTYLACPPTSVPRQPLFSGDGPICNPQISRLKGENAEKLLFLKYNLPFTNLELRDEISLCYNSI